MCSTVTTYTNSSLPDDFRVDLSNVILFGWECIIKGEKSQKFYPKEVSDRIKEVYNNGDMCLSVPWVLQAGPNAGTTITHEIHLISGVVIAKGIANRWGDSWPEHRLIIQSNEYFPIDMIGAMEYEKDREEKKKQKIQEYKALKADELKESAAFNASVQEFETSKIKSADQCNMSPLRSMSCSFCEETPQQEFSLRSFSLGGDETIPSPPDSPMDLIEEEEEPCHTPPQLASPLLPPKLNRRNRDSQQDAIFEMAVGRTMSLM